MNGIVPALAQPVDDPAGHASIGEKTHPAALRRNNLLLCEPGCVFERLTDISGLEVRVVVEDFVCARTMGDLPHDDRYRNAHATDARPPAHNFRVERDSIESHRLLPVRATARRYLGTASHIASSGLMRPCARPGQRAQAHAPGP